MQVSVHQPGGAQQKAQGVVDEFFYLWNGAVIVDVGCRTRDIESALAGLPYKQYIGVDIDPDAEVVADLGKKLPFDDNFADVVTALDVLEHTDSIHQSFDELCRVANKAVIITLPNCYDIGIRLRFLRGRPISDKYGLPIEHVVDRHRWVFSMDDAARFTKANAERNGWKVVAERAIVGPRRMSRLGPAVRWWPNVFSGTYLAVLEPA